MSKQDVATSRLRRSQLALHVLTDREWLRGRSHFLVATEAIQGGATVIQLRDKKASTHQLVEVGLELRELTRKHNVLLIVNDRIDVALAIDADGAHVGQNDMPGEYARKLLGPERILGISAGTMDEAIAAIASGADYLGIGPVYATKTKRDAGQAVGLNLFQEISRRYTTPLIGIGGITASNAAPIIQAGATGVAVISAIVFEENIVEATSKLARALTQ